MSLRLSAKFMPIMSAQLLIYSTVRDAHCLRPPMTDVKGAGHSLPVAELSPVSAINHSVVHTNTDPPPSHHGVQASNYIKHMRKYGRANTRIDSADGVSHATTQFLVTNRSVHNSWSFCTATGLRKLHRANCMYNSLPTECNNHKDEHQSK